MKITFRTLAAIAVGTMILMSAAADAGTRPGIGPDEARRPDHEVELLRRLIMLAKTN